MFGILGHPKDKGSNTGRSRTMDSFTDYIGSSEASDRYDPDVDQNEVLQLLRKVHMQGRFEGEYGHKPSDEELANYMGAIAAQHEEEDAEDRETIIVVS